MSKFTGICALLLCACIAGCASIGMPQGGPKDETPPKLMKSKPDNNATGWNKNKIEIEFDELVSVQNASEKVVVSPPQKKPASVSTVMKKVVVELKDSLMPNTTYTIDFSDAIVDYNESNPYGQYLFSFSTGDSIDSLCVSGHVLDAATLSPKQGVVVGAHANLDDSTFIKEKFLRIAQTDEHGYFCIRGLKDIPYNIYALGDQNRDYRFDQKGEGIAFPDSAVRPWAEPCLKPDTVWKAMAKGDTLRLVDSVVMRPTTCFKPDNLLLMYFNEDFGRQYLVKSERKEANQLRLFFSYRADCLPQVRVLNPDSTLGQDSLYWQNDWFVLEDNPTHDSLCYWVKDSALIKLDTIRLQIDYLKTGSNDSLTAARDTVNFVYRPKAATDDGKNKKTGNKRKRNEQPADSTQKAKPEVKHFKMNAQLGKEIEIYAIPTFTWESPVAHDSLAAWHLYQKVDTLWQALSGFELEQDEYNPRKYHFYYDWDYGQDYMLSLDSGAYRCLYDSITNAAAKFEFKTKFEKTYSRLVVNIVGLNQGQPAFVELLNSKDELVYRESVIDGVADCLNLPAGDFYLRLILDNNDDFVWTTGSYQTKRQPEQVLYLNKKLTLRSNWTIQESWNIWELPIEEQKPKELIQTDSKKKK